MIEQESTAPVEESRTAIESAPSTPSNDTPTLGAEVDAMFGYRAPMSVRDDSDDEAAGAPPAPSSQTSTTDQPTDGAPPTASQPTTTEAPAPTDDPLKDATALTYNVNGQSRTDDRIKVVKDLGAFIDPKDLPYIQQRLSERDHLHETSKASYEKFSQLEALTVWPKRDTDGKVVGSMTGRDAIEAARLDYGNAIAELNAYKALFQDPQRLASMLTYDQERGAFGLDEAARQQLAMLVENHQLKLRPAIRQHLSSIASGPAPTTTPSAATSAPAVDPASAVSAAITHSGVTGLTDADKAWAQGIVSRYVRTATADDVRQTPTLTVGEPILDPQFFELLTDRAQLRAESAKQVDAAATAAKANAPKLAAALRPQTRQAAPTRQPTRQNTDEETLSPEEEAYLRFERSGAAALRARSA